MKEEMKHDYGDVEYMVQQITTGRIGKKLKYNVYYLNDKAYIDSAFTFSNNTFFLEYGEEGYHSRYSDTFFTSYRVFYHGNLVYDYDEKKKNVPSQKIYEEHWINDLRNLYRYHLEVKKEEQRRYEEELKRLKKIFCQRKK